MRKTVRYWQNWHKHSAEYWVEVLAGSSIASFIHFFLLHLILSRVEPAYIRHRSEVSQLILASKSVEWSLGVYVSCPVSLRATSYEYPGMHANHRNPQPNVMDLSRADFIPVGCLVVTRQESGLSLERWSIEEIRDWKVFVLEASPESLNAKTLPYDIQASLLNTTKLKRFSSLFLALWIKLEFCVQHKSPEFGTVRVYFLPDDVLRSVVDRSSSYLQKVRLTIFDEISYSNEVWNGESHLQHISRLPLFVGEEQRAGTDTDVSLLQLFNEIPSPSPAAESINDPYSKEVMYNLLQSNVAGLKTKLYPYQRRSAALMLQKEVQPGNVLDPRLLQVLDQHGASWFLDPVTGTILREPRYYDGVSGGILAEQMGSGKTLMCLALILATKTLPTQPPEHYRSGDVPIRRALAPLAEMAASCATRNAVPWKPYFDLCKVQSGEEYSQCIEALERNPGYYLLPLAEPRRVGRRPTTLCAEPPKRKIYLSNGSIVVVPNNLVAQWKQEISKHTDGLELFVVTRDDHLPRAKDLIKFDLIIFPQTRFEAMVKQEGGLSQTPLCHIHFKRCIVDEGHKLGNSKLSSKSNLLIGLDSLHVSSRWIMTGTPSQGLYGVDDSRASDGVSKNIENHPSTANPDSMAKSSSLVMERKDLERIGSIAALYLKARPWANTTRDAGDTLADWTVYLLLPKHKSTSRGRWESLESTLKSLIIRHQLSEISTLLPPVDEKVVVLEGSYQDQLSLNIFSMMIIFNAVQSQRTDLDYFFHTKQRKFLLELVYNLKQASFFGGSFFDKEDISKAVQTAEEFLQEQKVPISLQDKQLLVQAIDVGHRAAQDKLRSLSNQFHEMPVSVEGFPTEFGQAWSLNDVAGVGTLSSASMLLALQRLIHKASGKPEELNSLLNGHLIHEGMKQRESMLSDLTDDVAPSHNPSETLAGNTKFGSDNHRNLRTQSVNGLKAGEATTVDGSLGPLESVKVTATVSSKLSYLVDSIIKYQEDEKILIFYENDNVAWYLGSMLEAVG